MEKWGICKCRIHFEDGSLYKVVRRQSTSVEAEVEKMSKSKFNVVNPDDLGK